MGRASLLGETPLRTIAAVSEVMAAGILSSTSAKTQGAQAQPGEFYSLEIAIQGQLHQY